MRRFLFDTNIVFDVLLEREPHLRWSAQVWAAVERGAAAGMLAAHAVTTIHSLLRKHAGEESARRVLGAMLGLFEVAPVDGNVIRSAMDNPGPDFEDAVTASAAAAARCDAIVTRDPRGFPGGPVAVMTAEAACALLAARSGGRSRRLSPGRSRA
ncbi:MAG: PIN domain-containing protein [Candidatus Solibacter usitatus]|nr:PIN domain-containing protein [Candidatus Solibacter usitatus]